MNGQLISSRREFPHVAVYAGPGAVMRIAFRNRESVAGTWRGILKGIPGILCLVAWPFFLSYGSQWAQQAGFAWGWGLAAGVLVSGGVVLWAMAPSTLDRAIELDFANDQLRVYDGNALQTARQLSTLASLTLDEHPQAALERQRSPGKVGQFQKQHCLFGWFGPGGAERVALVSRWEFPRKDSLFEVQQAIHWALQQQAALVQAGQGGGPEMAGAVPGPATIKPPLD